VAEISKQVKDKHEYDITHGRLVADDRTS